MLVGTLMSGAWPSEPHAPRARHAAPVAVAISRRMVIVGPQTVVGRLAEHKEVETPAVTYGLGAEVVVLPSSSGATMRVVTRSEGEGRRGDQIKP
jgi:hypothetical protein